MLDLKKARYSESQWEDMKKGWLQNSEQEENYKKQKDSRRNDNVLYKATLWRTDWNSIPVKSNFSKEEKFLTKLLKCKCREYNSGSIEEIQCLTSWVTFLWMSNLLLISIKLLAPY